MSHFAVRGALGAVAAVLGSAPALPASAAVAADHLTVTVLHAGDGRDGTYELSCHPGAGSHPDVGGACLVLDRNTRWGRDTFAPVAPGTACTMIYGGPATAHVTGTWAGRPVDATYDRSNGCEIGRWDRMVPLLPDLGTSGRLG
ncbi:SSI family serine proteinase inhibitor [Streptomyces sp. NPDC001980]|uniref:SSI family serine proteinase inhibitor n=1 Tax=Streptomyces sp. NPDC001980 TaxID=3157126 RepID=UPI00332D80F3